MVKLNAQLASFKMIFTCAITIHQCPEEIGLDENVFPSSALLLEEIYNPFKLGSAYLLHSQLRAKIAEF